MAHIHYARVAELWRKEDKYKYLETQQQADNVEWQELTPDTKQTWLTDDLDKDFDSFILMGSKEAKSASPEKAAALFKDYSLGVSTNRDDVVYDFDEKALLRRIERFCEAYNAEVARYHQLNKPADLDSFLKYDKIKWSRNLKRELRIGRKLSFAKEHIRPALYRPFTKRSLYFSDIVIDEAGKSKIFFPTGASADENLVISVSDKGLRSPFTALISDCVTDLHLGASTDGFECFPFYTYNEDGTNRRENITDWALAQFRTQYRDEAITKWDIFHYVYAVLHHPMYRERYAANLKR